MDKNKKLIIGALVIGAGLFFSLRTAQTSDQGVRLTQLKTGAEDSKVQLEGVVVPEDNALTSVYAEVPVVIDRVEAVVGSRVKEGDTIVTFTNEAKREAEKALEEVNIQLNSQEAISASMNRQARNAGYESEVSQKQAEVNKELLRADAISSLDVAKSEAIANRDRANYEDLSARKEVESQKYNQLRMKQEELEKKLRFVARDLRAPKDGIITELKLQNGAILREGEKIYSLAEEGMYKVAVEAPANIIGSLKEGAKTTVKDLTNSSGKLFEGTVSKVSRVARNDAKNNKVIDLEIILEDAQGLNPGFLTSVEISGMENPGAKMADAFSVIDENNETYVYVVENGTVKKVPVQVGVRTSTKYEIMNLPEGTEIIVNAAKVKPGDKVKVIK
ncbi:MAG: efflux RND transporter periplasmic adaptor subunit [Fusobacteriaceae bacterium]